MQMRDIQDFDSIRLKLASPETIRKWSYGEVKKPETINYRTLRPEKDGLFCERIFGTTKEWECFCGKFKSIRYKGVICDRCGVEVTHFKVRRERTGHIELAAPVSHIWYYRSVPSRMGLLLDLGVQALRSVLYYEKYIVIDPGDTDLKQNQLLTEDEYQAAEERYGGSFTAGMGAEAIKTLLEKLDLNALSVELRDKMKEKGAKTLAISNVLGSTLTREADNVIYTLAGPEISVASTKAYSSQVLVLYLLSLYIGLKFEKIQEKEYVSLIKDITKLKANIEKIIENKNTIYEIAKIIKDTQNGFYLGRGIDEKIAREGSLKMKEINYIHTESLPAGELKHGSIALIENGVLVVVISTDLEMDEKTVSNIKEVKARGAYVVGVAKKGSLVSEAADKYIEIEDSGLLLTPLTAAIALQYLAYYTAYAKGYDMDKPRNLAKSVTVE